MLIACAGKLTAVGTVIIGGNQEEGIWINRLAFERQTFDTLRLIVDQLAFTVVTCRLADVDLIIYPVNHIKVIGAETVPVDQSLWFGAVNVDLIELPGGTFQPFFHLFAGSFHHYQCIGIEVEIRSVTEGELAFLHFNEAGRIVFASANFERRSG